MTPLGEKLISLMKNDKTTQGSTVEYYFAPNIPQDWIDNVRQKQKWNAKEEVYCMALRGGKPLWGLPKDATLYTESGIYWDQLDAICFSEHDTRYISFSDLYAAYHERHQEKKDLFGYPRIAIGVNAKKSKDPQYLLEGAFWSDFFEFYAKYTGGDNLDEKQPPVTGCIKVCEYCGKKFDATLNTCPGCGAPA